MRASRFLLPMLASLLLACTQQTVKEPFADKISKEREVESRVQIALIYMEEGELEQAISELRQARDVKPRSARVHEVLAIALERTLDFERAENNFQLMLRYDRDYTRGRANYASYLVRRGNCEEAYRQFHIVVNDIFYPNRAIAYQQLARCAGELGKHEEMISAYQRAVALDNRIARPFLELAWIHFDTGEYPESQDYLDKYRERVDQANASALLLGIRLARVFQDRSAEVSNAMALKNLYPRSAEYLEYLEIKQANQ